MSAKAFAILAATFVALSSAAFAQDWRGSGRVEGIVRDAGGNPIEGATVSLRWTDGKGPDIQTNKKGRWAILGLNGGAWNVDISAPGFQTRKISYNVSQASRNPTMEIALDPVVQQPAKQEVLIGGQKVSNEAGEAIDKANAAWSQKNWAEARAQYERVLQEVPANESLLEHTELACYQGKQFDDALQYARKIVALDSGNTTSWLMIAEIELQKGNLDEGKAALEKVPDEKIIDPAPYLNTGINYYNKNRVGEAEMWFTKAINKSPESVENADSYYYRGLTRYSEKHAADAKTDFEKYLQLAPAGSNADTVKELLKSMVPAHPHKKTSK